MTTHDNEDEGNDVSAAAAAASAVGGGVVNDVKVEARGITLMQSQSISLTDCHPAHRHQHVIQLSRLSLVFLVITFSHWALWLRLLTLQWDCQVNARRRGP